MCYTEKIEHDQQQPGTTRTVNPAERTIARRSADLTRPTKMLCVCGNSDGRLAAWVSNECVRNRSSTLCLLPFSLLYVRIRTDRNSVKQHRPQAALVDR